MSDVAFLPWSQPLLTTAAVAGQVDVQLHFTADGASDQVTRPLQLHGPGHVIGLQPSAVVRTLPGAGELQFAPNLLAGVEFYEEDLPWRYSPSAAASGTGASQVIPWLFLAVLEAGEYELPPQEFAPLPLVRIRLATDQGAETHALPNTNAAPLWPWAHVQLNASLGAAGTAATPEAFLNGELRQNPDLGLSRLLSPRRLKPDTAYRAFLIPTFEAGRRAGLGLPVPAGTASQVAWMASATQLHTGPLDFPIYLQWEFQTGAGGDFEALARRLRPAAASALAGPRFDVTVPAYLKSQALQFTLALPTALQPLNTAPSATPATVQNYLQRELLPAAQPPVRSSGSTYRRPVLTAPVYGRSYHAQGATLQPPTAPGPDWKTTANLDVRYRAVASLGARLVEEHQEEFVRRAWEQVGDVLVANAQLRGMQSGLQTTDGLRRQHLPATEGVAGRALGGGNSSQFDTSPMANYGLHLTGLAWRRLRLPGSANTLYEEARQSTFPLAALSPAFRRVAKPFGRYQTSQTGPLRRPSLPEATVPEPTLYGASIRQYDQLLHLINMGTITAAPPKPGAVLSYQFVDAAVDAVFANTNPETGIAALTQLYGPNGAPIDNETALFGPVKQAYIRFSSYNGLPVKFTPPAAAPHTLDLDEVKQALLMGTDPTPWFVARANRALRRVPHYGAYTQASSLLGGQQRQAGGGTVEPHLPVVKPVMAYPVFKDALGELLRRQRPDLLAPGITQLAANSVLLFEPNQAFIEAYLLGANHALGTELLWREFPTDLRGSYFRQFWDVSEQRALQTVYPDPAQAEEALRDVAPLHSWGTKALGSNANAASAPDTVLLVLRADLLTRYSNTVVCAQRAVAVQILPGTELRPDGTQTVYPTKRLTLGQDVVAFEFPLSQEAVVGSTAAPDLGYFFVLLERPGEAQFGLDETAVTPSTWQNLAWPDVNTPVGEHLAVTATSPAVAQPAPATFSTITDAGQLAYALFQQPVAVAIHATELL